MSFLFSLVGEPTFLPPSDVELALVIPDNADVEYLEPNAVLEFLYLKGVRLVYWHSQCCVSLSSELTQLFGSMVVFRLARQHWKDQVLQRDLEAWTQNYFRCLNSFVLVVLLVFVPQIA